MEGGRREPSTAPPGFVALSGAASVVLTMVGVGLTDHGGKGLSPDMSSSKIIEGFAAAAGDVRAGAAIIGVAIVLNIVFLGVLWDRLRRGSPWLGAVALAGGVLGAGLLALHAVIAVAGAVAADTGAAETARTLLTLEWEYARVVVPASLAVVGPATVAGSHFGVFPQWFNWMSLAFTVLLTVALLPVGPAGLIGAAGGIWVIIASIVIALDPGTWAPSR